MGAVPMTDSDSFEAMTMDVDGAPTPDHTYTHTHTNTLPQDKLSSGQLSGCRKTCAPTLSMLRLSESPVVTLSQGKFGTQTTGLTASKTAPDPKCEATVGPLTTGGSVLVHP